MAISLVESGTPILLNNGDNMYKKTTTIVEEQTDDTFNHRLPGDIFNSISNENTNLGISLRMNSREYYALYTIYMRDYLNVVYNKAPTANLKNIISTHATSELTTLLVPWITVPSIPQATIDAFLASSADMANSFCGVIDATLGSGNKEEAVAMARKAITDFSMNLYAIVYLFAKDRTSAILNSYLDTIISQAENRMAGEWAADGEAYYTGFGILSSAPVPGILTFADVISNGFIQAQPWRFTQKKEN